MLLRAAVIYVLAVGILLLGGAVAVQRIQISAVNGERVAAEAQSDDLRKQLDQIHSDKSDLERLVRLSSYGIGEEKLKRDAAEQLVRQLRDQLDTLSASNQFSESARKAAEVKLSTPATDVASQDVVLADARKDLERARQAADAAEKEVDELRQQVLGLSARIAALTPPVQVGGAAAGSATTLSKQPAPAETSALPDKAEEKPVTKPAEKSEIHRPPAKQAAHVKHDPPRRARRATSGTSEGAAASSGSSDSFAPF